MQEYKKKANSGDDVFIRIQPSRKPIPGILSHDESDQDNHPPTALLLGWLGAKHKNLSKYSALFEQMGYNVMQCVASPSTVFAVKPQNTAKFLLSLLRIIFSDDRLNKGGLVLMMFSNGGAICAPHLAKFFAGEYRDLIRTDDEPVVKTAKDAMAAILFDSSPVYMHVHLGARAINDGMQVPDGILRWIVYVLFALLCILQTVFVVFLPSFFWNGLRNADYLCPEQYIYSTKDHLQDIPRLEALIKERELKGKEVRVYRVEDSEHCMLLRKHPEEYKAVIRGVNEWGVNVFRKRKGMLPWTLPDSSAS